MVPDFEEIIIDEEDIYEETEDMINRCPPQTHDAADLEEVNINDSTISLGRRAVHPLKSSLTRSSGCTSAASTEEASSMMDESSTMMLDESLLIQSGFSRSQIKCIPQWRPGKWQTQKASKDRGRGGSVSRKCGAGQQERFAVGSLSKFSGNFGRTFLENRMQFLSVHANYSFVL